MKSRQAAAADPQSCLPNTFSLLAIRSVQRREPVLQLHGARRFVAAGTKFRFGVNNHSTVGVSAASTASKAPAAGDLLTIIPARSFSGDDDVRVRSEAVSGAKEQVESRAGDRARLFCAVTLITLSSLGIALWLATFASTVACGPGRHPAGLERRDGVLVVRNSSSLRSPLLSTAQSVYREDDLAGCISEETVSGLSTFQAQRQSSPK